MSVDVADTLPKDLALPNKTQNFVVPRKQRFGRFCIASRTLRFFKLPIAISPTIKG